MRTVLCMEKGATQRAFSLPGHSLLALVGRSFPTIRCILLAATGRSLARPRNAEGHSRLLSACKHPSVFHSPNSFYVWLWFCILSLPSTEITFLFLRSCVCFTLLRIAKGLVDDFHAPCLCQCGSQRGHVPGSFTRREVAKWDKSRFESRQVGVYYKR